jgi:arabinofuranan 3-O-arabinosyltransferase
LLPLGALPWAVAKPAWAVVTLAATGMLYWCARTDLAPRLDSRLLAFGFLLLLISTPYRNVLSNGQEAIFAVATFAMALRQARRGQTAIAGLFLALSWFKYTLTFPLSLVFVARRDWRVLAVAAATHAVLTLAAAWWTGTDLVASTFGFFAVARLAIDYRFGFLDVNSIAAHLALPYALAAVAAVALAAAGLVLAWRLRDRDEPLLLAVTSLMAMAAFYHFSYDCVIFVFPLLYVLQAMARGAVRGPGWAFVPLVVAAIAATWFLNRIVAGNNEGYGFGGAGYTTFYWAMIASFYAAMFAGIHRLWTATRTETI